MDEAETPIPGLKITEGQMAYRISQNAPLMKRGLELHQHFYTIAEEQEAAREEAERAAKARGEQPKFVATAEELAWDAHRDRELTGIALHHRDVLEQFGLDPRKSVLFDRFPELMTIVCDPQVPVIYDPSARQFAFMETWGPALRVFEYCPYTGQQLPPELSDTWCDLIDTLMGTQDWTSADVRKQLGDAYFTEAWWIERSL
ncbi:MAG: hypothetical protein AAGF59_11895 [Pseudomonadota bacterium]